MLLGSNWRCELLSVELWTGGSVGIARAPALMVMRRLSVDKKYILSLAVDEVFRDSLRWLSSLCRRSLNVDLTEKEGELA